jgi:hypothetical protein
MGSHIWTRYLRTVTLVGDVNMETKLCSLLQLNNATDTVLLSNGREVGDLVLSRTSFQTKHTEQFPRRQEISET